MKNVLSVLQYVPKRASIIAAIAAAVIVPTASFAWGPARDTYTTAHPADHVVFNSITDNPVQGDERNFVQVRESTANNSTYADSIALTPGRDYVIYMYYHNDAASNLNASGKGVATGVTAKAEIPAVVANGATATKAVGYIDSNQTTPVWDDVSFSNTSGGDIALRYVPGSATIHSLGKVDGQTLGDSIVTTGTNLGYNALDGKVPGCNDYAGYVTFRVHADQPNFTINKYVRTQGSTTWNQSTTATAGQTVQYELAYKNTGSTTQNNVVLKDALPQGVAYVPGTTMIKNGNFPAGKAIGDDLFTAGGINIGNYAPTGEGYLMFNATVEQADALTCGVNTFTNTATAATSNGSKTSTAVVTVDKTCDTPPVTPPATPVTPPSTPPTPQALPSTGPVEVISGLLGTSGLGYGVNAFIRSRHALKESLLAQ